MLKILEEKGKYRLVYRYGERNNYGTSTFVCQTPDAVAKRVHMIFKDYMAVHLMHMAFIEGGKLWFSHMDDAKRCYLDIAFDTWKVDKEPERSYFIAKEIDKDIYVIQRIYDYVSLAEEIDQMARMIKINKQEFVDILIKNNGKKVSATSYIFISKNDCLSCINELNDFSLGKQVMKKLTKK